jgi:hypothetical protein
MTTLRIVFATLVIVLGLYYAIMGVLAVVILHGMGTAPFPQLAVASWLLMLPLGLIALCCGVGLLLLQPWSRRLWLGTSAFLIAFHTLWLVSDFRADPHILPLVPAVTIVAFCIASWWFLNLHAAQHLFTQSRQVI